MMKSIRISNVFRPGDQEFLSLLMKTMIYNKKVQCNKQNTELKNFERVKN